MVARQEREKGRGTMGIEDFKDKVIVGLYEIKYVKLEITCKAQ